MVDIRIEGDRAVFEVEGWDKMWAVKSRVEIPLVHIWRYQAGLHPREAGAVSEVAVVQD